MAQDAGDLYHCPHLEARDLFVEVDHPVAGKARYPGLGPRLSGHQYQARRPAPLLGQHNRELLGRELGYPAQELMRLRAAGVI